MSCFKFIILDTTLVKQWYKTEIEVEPVYFRENQCDFCLFVNHNNRCDKKIAQNSIQSKLICSTDTFSGILIAFYKLSNAYTTWFFHVNLTQYRIMI